jgi:trehalose 6-phosphate phosphatase
MEQQRLCRFSEGKVTVSRQGLEAVVFDLDGVVTQTAKVHASAWKAMFDAFLAQRAVSTGRSYEPFDIQTDYRRHVDGKPRYDGVESFLAARQIRLPYGEPGDAPGEQSVCGLGNRKNALFLEKIAHEGVQVYESTVALARRLRALHVRTAVVSSSRNCAAILDAAGLADLFEVRVDGADAARLRLAGKPAPDLFLEAARRLGVGAARAVVVEDSAVGVEAGRRGGFGCVIGVNRGDRAEALRTRGADAIVSDLAEVAVEDGATEATEDGVELPSALSHLDTIVPPSGRRLAVFLDYDGTLTPIVERPDLAVLPGRMRQTLTRLARSCPVAVLSGRDLVDVRGKVGIGTLCYAGSHGFDIAGPGGQHLEHQQGTDFLPILDQAETALRETLAPVRGCLVERKRFGVAVHFRQVADRDLDAVARAVRQTHESFPRLRLRGGKKVYDLQPAIDWDKGKALEWLLQAMELDHPAVIPLYIGDDLTDEDTFRAVRERGAGILVAEGLRKTLARYRLSNPSEVQRFLDKLVARLGAPEG